MASTVTLTSTGALASFEAWAVRVAAEMSMARVRVVLPSRTVLLVVLVVLVVLVARSSPPWGEGMVLIVLLLSL